MIHGLELVEPPFSEAYRIIPSRFPPVGVFDELADPQELTVLFEIEARTNERLREDLGALELVAEDDWVVGPGSTAVMGAFMHPSTSGSRFSDGTFGIYYCGDSEAVAIRESAHHRAAFLCATAEAPCRVEMRQYVGRLAKPLVDGRAELEAAVLHDSDYAESRLLGGELRAAKAYGLVYPSVRAKGGLCAALFRPPAIAGVRQSRMYQYLFDGRRIKEVLPIGDTISLPDS